MEKSTKYMVVAYSLDATINSTPLYWSCTIDQTMTDLHLPVSLSYKLIDASLLLSLKTAQDTLKILQNLCPDYLFFIQEVPETKLKMLINDCAEKLKEIKELMQQDSITYSIK